MVPQEQEISNHTIEDLSSAGGYHPSPTMERTACLPDRTASQHVPGVGQEGYTQEDIEDLDDEVVYDWRLYSKQELRELKQRLKEPQSPLLVIRGAQNYTPTTSLPQKSSVDYLAFTSEEPISILFEFVELLILEGVSFFQGQGGWKGYKHYYNINLYGQTIGRICFGATHGRNYLQISGDGCRRIKDWGYVVHLLNLLTKCSLSRVDLAVDYYDGELTEQKVKEAYSQNAFKLPKARENPTFDFRQPIGGNGLPNGWTAYIGKRENAKFARIYHKGIEQFGRLSELQQEQFKHIWGQVSVGEEYNPPEGAVFQNWVRAEVEYKSKNMVLAFDMLVNRDSYFSGAYPYFEEILPMADTSRPTYKPNSYQTEIVKMFSAMQQQYGSFITTMLATGMSPEEICYNIANGKLNQRIIKAGGLEVIKPYDPRVLKGGFKAPQDE